MLFGAESIPLSPEKTMFVKNKSIPLGIEGDAMTIAVDFSLERIL